MAWKRQPLLDLPRGHILRHWRWPSEHHIPRLGAGSRLHPRADFFTVIPNSWRTRFCCQFSFAAILLRRRCQHMEGNAHTAAVGFRFNSRSSFCPSTKQGPTLAPAIFFLHCDPVTKLSSALPVASQPLSRRSAPPCARRSTPS